MNSKTYHNLLTLRVFVSFLGEREQAGWWSSSFLSNSSDAFLSPVFPKTVSVAKVNGAAIAAQLVHDEHIGRGNVYHLFRLPEIIEHNLSQLLFEDTPVLELVASEEKARTGLKMLSAESTTLFASRPQKQN